MGRVGDLLTVLRRDEPRSAPSGWALALDATIAVAAAAGALLEVGYRNATFHPKITPAPHIDIITHTVAAHPATTTLIAAALTALPLALRRLYPITVLLVIMVAIVAVRTDYVPPIAFATAVFAAYSAVVHSRYRNLAVGVVLAVALLVTATFADTLPRFPARFTALFAILPAAAAGLGIRELRRRLSDTAARLRRATEEHEAATRRAIEAERARIAGELHDVLTHSVSVMVVQAGAARSVLASSPVEAEQALLAVEAGGRTAMAELRNLLGLLSPSDGSDENVALRPQPGLGELDTLIGGVSAAGLPVQLQVSGTPRPLPPGADLAAYRVIQEALTNVLRPDGDLGQRRMGGKADHRGQRQRRRVRSRRRCAGAWLARPPGTVVALRRTAGRRAAAQRRLAGTGGRADRARHMNVVIADDQALVRGGFRLILNAAGIDVVAEAANGAEAIAAVLKHRPDVVLMDIRMPEVDGIEATRRILAAGPALTNVRIIILTTFDLDQYVYAALAAGASGFLLKDVTPEHLVAAVQLVRTGDALLAPTITRRLVKRFAPNSTPTAALPGSPGCDVSALTPRERDVLGWVARGMSNAEIAAALTLSEATVKTHVARILTKLGLRDRVQAVVLAYETGLVSADLPLPRRAVSSA